MDFVSVAGRDAATGSAVNGIMNAVEINVRNLTKWLAGQAPAHDWQ